MSSIIISSQTSFQFKLTLRLRNINIFFNLIDKMLHFHKISSLVRLLGLGLAIITVVYATQTFKELEVLTPAQKVSLERVSKTAHFIFGYVNLQSFNNVCFQLKNAVSSILPHDYMKEDIYLAKFLKCN